MAARRIVGREPNGRLQALIDEANYSNNGLARRVNLRGAERGLDLRYDKTSVSRWLRGQQPRGMTPFIMTEVLGEKLGRVVSVDEIGMTGGRRHEASAVGLEFTSTFAQAGGPGHVPSAEEQTLANRRILVRLRVYRFPPAGPVVLADRRRDWRCHARVASASARRISNWWCEPRSTWAISTTGHGSGHVRPMAMHDPQQRRLLPVQGKLWREGGGPPIVRRGSPPDRTCGGYMAIDDGNVALALRYYVQALRLSQAAEDRGLGDTSWRRVWVIWPPRRDILAK